MPANFEFEHLQALKYNQVFQQIHKPSQWIKSYILIILLDIIKFYDFHLFNIFLV